MLRIATLNLNYYIEKHGSWELRKKLIVDYFKIKNHTSSLFKPLPNIETDMKEKIRPFSCMKH